MTSKNLCFKLMKEDLKRRVWTVALILLSFFFAVIVPVIYVSGETQMAYRTKEQWMRYLQRGMLEMLGEGNPFVVMILVVAAVVCAASGFSYLHAARKVDLYHSLPVKRGQLFLSHYLNGILMVGVIYLAALLIGMVIAAAAGVGFDVTGSVVMKGYVFHMAFFCLLYTTMVIAMVLTGNIIIALLGDAVFCFYGPLVTALLQGYMNTWFLTYSYNSPVLGGEALDRMMINSSPFMSYMSQIDSYSHGFRWKSIVVVLLISAVLAVLGWWLYGKRPSEGAGKAMAFKQIMTPIKILLVIPAALSFALFFWSMRNTMGWAVFGLLCGAVIMHCLMEIIYHFDFRRLFAHKIHLVVCIVASLVLLCGFKYDWFGYDSYLPKGSQVKSASITLSGLDDWVTYGKVKKSEGRNGEEYYSWQYEDSEIYLTEHMEMTDIADILSIAQRGIQENKGREGGSSWMNGRYRSGYTVRYTLQNGRKIIRRYDIYADMIQEEIQRIFDSREYKMGAFPVLSQTAEDTTRINFQQFNQISKVDVETGSPELAEVLAAYQKDLNELTMDTRKQEIPVATIQFVTQEMDEALYQYGAQLSENEYRYQVYNIADRCYYPVYPSFTNTIALLEKYGIAVENRIPADNITGISIQIYGKGLESDAETGENVYTETADWVYAESVYEDGAYTLTFNGRSEIEALVPALIPYDYYNMNRVNEVMLNEEIEATVYLKTDLSDKVVTCYLDETKLPEFVK